MGLEVDTRGLAVFGAQRTVLALFRIEVNLQERETAEETEERTHWTNGVAISTSVIPCESGQYAPSQNGNDGDQIVIGNFLADVIERIAVVVFRNTCQHIVACYPHRLQQVSDYASVGGVGGQKLEQRADACHEGDDEQHEYGVAQPLHLFGVGVAVLLLLLAQPPEDVLHDA